MSDVTISVAENGRIEELRLLAPDEGIVPNDESEMDLRNFIAAFGEAHAIFLLDSGNYRARWYSSVFGTAIEFRGKGELRILHLKRQAAVE